MLIISRHENQKLIINDEIEITIVEISGTRVRFGIKAPRHITVHTRRKGNEPAESEDSVAVTEMPTDPITKSALPAFTKGK